MDVAVAEEPPRKIFRAKKTMKVSDRRQLESLHTTLSSPCSFPSPPQPAMVNGKHCEAVSMEVDKEIHGTTHTTTHATSSLIATSLSTETSEEPTASELQVSSSQNIHFDVKDVQEEGEGDKESTLPSLEVEDKLKGDRNSKGDVIVSSPVSSEKTTEAVRERQVVGMEMDLVPGTTQDTVPILNPAASPLLSSNTTVESVSSPSLSPSYTAESDQEVRPGFLVLSEDDDDVQDESDEEQRECEGVVEKVEVNMKEPEQFVSGAPVDSPSPSSPTPLQIDEEEGAALQKKRSLSGGSEDGGEKQGERDLEVVERHNKRPRVDCEELEAHVELKISGSAERQHKLKKVVQQLVEEQLCVLQLTLFDKSLQGLRDRLDKIEKHPSALKSLQAKIGRLSKKVGTAIQARENAKKPPEVLLPPTFTHATATTPAGSAILGLRTMGNNTPDPKRNDQSSQTPTPVRNDQGSQTPTPVRNDQGSQTPTPLRNVQGSQTSTPVPTASLLPSPSSTASAGSQPTSQTLMLSTCVTPKPGPSAFPLQSFLIQLPGGGTAILTNPTNSQLIPVCALPAMTSSTVTPTTAFLLQRTTPYTPAAPKPPSASALLSHFAAIPTTTTTPTDTPAATTSHMTTPITTPTCRATTTPWATTITTPTCRATTTPWATTVTTPTCRPTPRATTVATPRATTVATPRAITVATPRATTVATPRATTVATPRAITVATPRATTVATPMATTITTPRAITTPTRRATTTLCATPNVSHPGATGTVGRPSSGVSVSVCESIRLVSVTNSTSTSSLPRFSMPATTGTQPSVRPAASVHQAASVQLAAPVPRVPAKTGSESTNPPSDSTQASHPAKSEAFIDLTEEEEEDDDDVLVTGVLKAPLALKASPSPSTAGQRTAATQQTSTSVGTQAVRSSLGQMSGVGSPHAVYHRPLQGSPSKSVALATSTSSSSTPCPQPSPLPPLPVPPQTISLPLEAASTSPPQQPLLKITRVPSHNDGIVLSWSVTEVDRSCAAVDSYHLYAYHQDHSGPSTQPLLWKKIGEVKALALPMACTLTQFVSGSKYYFAVRARDVFGRFGPFCEPQCTDVLTSPSPKAPV
ncbi:activating transcription factor 7-interacting protein 1-like isoform X2 [Oncorhynchus masou masou]